MQSNISKSQIKEELRKHWSAQAVELAHMGRWDEAVQTNQSIVELFPDDIRARNRLGKAYFELGRLEEAAAAYEESLKGQPSNNIARKRLVELYALLKREPEMPLGEGMPGIEMAEAEEEEPEPDEVEAVVDEEEPEPSLDEDPME